MVQNLPSMYFLNNNIYYNDFSIQMEPLYFLSSSFVSPVVSLCPAGTVVTMVKSQNRLGF